MIFLHPQFLWLLPIIFLLFYFILTQKEQQAHFFSEAVLKKLYVSGNSLSIKARNVLFLAMMVLVVFALSGPAIEGAKVNVEAKSADIMIALDISDSMLAEDVYPNRLALAKQKILNLLEQSPQERIGVMAFAKNAYLVSPLSFDHASVAFLVKQLNTDSITEKGTDFKQLLFSAANLLQKNEKKNLLILSDGGDASDFSEVIAYAKDKRIKVFVLGIGKNKGVPIVDVRHGGYVKYNGNIILTRLNENIATLALQSGGSYIEAVVSNDDVDAMLQEMHAKTERKTLKEEQIVQYIPLFYYPLGLAMVLFIIATSSMSKRQEVSVPPVVLLTVLLLATTLPTYAGILDFKRLDEAKRSYEAKEYAKSYQLYEEYAKQTDDAEAYYNAANALYKEGKYEQAQKMYQKVTGTEMTLRHNALHNLGNSYAKEGTPQALKKAIESYEKALKLRDDVQTRENLERVKEALKKMQQANQQNQQQNDHESQNRQKSHKADQNNSKQAPKSQQHDAHQEERSEQRSETTKQHEEQSPQERDAQASQKSNNEDSNNSKVRQAAKATATQNDKIMSRLEEEKWLKELNKNRTGHLYQLQKLENSDETYNDKPW